MVGCLERDRQKLGSIQVRNDSDFPQLVHVEPTDYPSSVPEPNERLSVTVYVEPDESKYYENFIEFSGRYEFTARLENEEVKTTTSELPFAEADDGTVSGYAIEFVVQQTGGLSWNITSREGTLE